MPAENRSDQPSDQPPSATPEEEATPLESSDNPSPSEPVAEVEAPEPMETIPVSEERAEEEGFAGRLLEACPACGTLMDVTEQAPFEQIYCPSCGQNLRARKQFNNYRLIELLGEGGMGSVFKAVDCNLNRHVALKILKKECSANEEERAMLAEEARVTASINHPHVVKVFLFGEDHGQFYLAMELVGKGTLDELMVLQRRVGEAQMLEVGIQIAQGLEAALEHGLIHRDIKPVNILFADSHTAKLVDFGLAIVMDEAASKIGEIWGTPYYIAPEKLENLPEDFRSDIYSLGGTMFHALSGRPPYEAETASMVALKQLKSQPVSLQAFAPDVSSETTYVINRMLAKNMGDRYQSYPELIDHLSYARNKLLERTQQPKKEKERVMMETQTTKNLAAFLSLGLLAAVLVCGFLVYTFRGELFGKGDAPVASSLSSAEVNGRFQEGIQMMGERRFDEAREAFGSLAALPDTPQPMQNWILMNEGLATLMAGDREAAAGIFAGLAGEDLYSTNPKDSALANFFIEAGSSLSSPDKEIPESITRIYSRNNFEAFGLLCFAFHDWENGNLQQAGPILKAFVRSRVKGEASWILDYVPLANIYYGDFEKLKPLETALPGVSNPGAAGVLLKKARETRDELQSGSHATDRLDAIEAELISKGATP